jgi:hypothetical protein
MNKANNRNANVVGSKSICLVTLRGCKFGKVGNIKGGRIVAVFGDSRCILALAFAFDWLDEGSFVVVDYLYI